MIVVAPVIVCQTVISQTGVFIPVISHLRCRHICSVQFFACDEVFDLVSIGFVCFAFVVIRFVDHLSGQCQSFYGFDVESEIDQGVLRLVVVPSSFFKTAQWVALHVYQCCWITSFITTPFTVALASYICRRNG